LRIVAGRWFVSVARPVIRSRPVICSRPVVGARFLIAGRCVSGLVVWAATSSSAAWPADAVQALAFVSAGLEFLAHSDPAEWSEGLQADCLRALAVAESRQTAAHAKVLSAFSRPGGGLAGDGHRSPRVWLTWQATATRRAAAGRVGWMRRLADHPAVSAALADGTMSVSWAQQIADWTDRLPAAVREAADTASSSRRPPPGPG
jgi:hypothetical protein